MVNPSFILGHTGWNKCREPGCATWQLPMASGSCFWCCFLTGSHPSLPQMWWLVNMKASLPLPHTQMSSVCSTLCSPAWLVSASCRQSLFTLTVMHAFGENKVAQDNVQRLAIIFHPSVSLISLSVSKVSQVQPFPLVVLLVVLISVILLGWPTCLSFSIKPKWTWPIQYIPHASAPWVNQISTAAALSTKDENLADTPYFHFLPVNVVFCWKSQKPLVSIACQWPSSFCVFTQLSLCVVVLLFSHY